jgi:hypothetical protein
MSKNDDREVKLQFLPFQTDVESRLARSIGTVARGTGARAVALLDRVIRRVARWRAWRSGPRSEIRSRR